MGSHVKELRATLNAALDVYEQEFEKTGFRDLDVNDTKPHPFDDPSYLPTPPLWDARRLLIASLGHLRALISPPVDRIFEVCYSVNECASLQVAVEAKIAGILEEEEKKWNEQGKEEPFAGLTREELGKRTGIEPGKLSRVLRLLAAQHLFRETSPNVFANTRLSALLKPGASVACLVAAMTRYNLPSASNLWKALSDPKWKDSYSFTEAPFNKAFGDISFFDYLGQDKARVSEFAIGMQGFGEPTVPGSLTDYPWSALGSKTVVDVAGGQGSFSLPLLRHYPQLKLVLQDKAEVLQVAEQHFEKNFPEALRDKRVTFEPFDFFTSEQKNKGDDFVFFLRWIVHDWPDHEVIRILKKIRPAMGKGSKLLICDAVPAYGTPPIASNPSAAESLKQQVAKFEDDSIPKTDGHIYEPVPWPAPLNQNGSEYARTPLLLDLLMLDYFNSRERTAPEMESVLIRAGFKVEKIWPTRSAKTSIVEAIVDWDATPEETPEETRVKAEPEKVNGEVNGHAPEVNGKDAVDDEIATPKGRGGTVKRASMLLKRVSNRFSIVGAPEK